MIVFHFLGKELGGVPMLIVRLTEALSKKGTAVKVIAPEDSFTIRELRRRNVQFYHIDTEHLDQNLVTRVSEEDILVCTKFESYLAPLKHKNPGILFYNIMVDFASLINHYKWGINFKSKTRRLLQTMHAGKALYFMDGAGVENVKEQLNLELSKPAFIPIPVDQLPQNIYLQEKKDFNRRIRITYVGRSEQWKILPFKKILMDLVKTTQQVETELVVSVVCDDQEKYKAQLGPVLDTLPRHITVQFFESIAPEKLSSFLTEHADLHFAMGTACLEGAKTGIPSVVMDISYQEIGDNYKYKWLYETPDYTLGNFLKPEVQYTGISMEALLGFYKNAPEKIDEVSERCFAYIQTHHTVEKVTHQLMKAAGTTQLRFNDCAPHIVYYSAWHKSLKQLSGKRESA